jgi:hypothetical protein
MDGGKYMVFLNLWILQTTIFSKEIPLTFPSLDIARIRAALSKIRAIVQRKFSRKRALFG